MRRNASTVTAVLLGASTALGACGTEVIAGLTLSQLSTGLSLASTLVTGKGTTEHAFDILTGEDCRFLEGALRGDRAFCEPTDSLATEDDFRGLMALLGDDSRGTAVAGVEPPPAPDGYGIGGGLEDRRPLLQVAVLPIADERALDHLTAGTALDNPAPPSVLANARAFADSGVNFPGGPGMIDTVRSINTDYGQMQWTLAQ